MTYTIAVCTVKNSDGGQRNCPKHGKFYSKNKIEKLVHLIGFIIIIYHEARSPENQNHKSRYDGFEAIIFVRVDCLEAHNWIEVLSSVRLVKRVTNNWRPNKW